MMTQRSWHNPTVGQPRHDSSLKTPGGNRMSRPAAALLKNYSVSRVKLIRYPACKTTSLAVDQNWKLRGQSRRRRKPNSASSKCKYKLKKKPEKRPRPYVLRWKRKPAVKQPRPRRKLHTCNAVWPSISTAQKRANGLWKG